MGAGSYGAGLGYAGTDPVFPTTVYVPADPPAAIYLDLGSRDALLDALGRFQEMDPIDQQVVLSFGVPRGYFKHSPETGHDFLTLPRLSTKLLDAEINRRAQQATPFADLIASGDVTFLGTTTTHPKRTESDIVIMYQKRGDTTTRTVLSGAG